MVSVFDEMVLTDIASLNVTETVVETEMSVELSAGLTEESVGAIVSVVLTITGASVSFSSSMAHEKIVRLKREMRIMCKILFIFFLYQ